MSSNTNQTNKAVKSEKKSKNSAVYENKLHQVSIANRQKLVYHLNVKDKASGETKNICFKPNDAKIGTKLFDWDPWIDGAAAIGSALAPELLPFIHSGKEALKHWLKGEKKEKKGKHHKESREEKKLEGAMRGAEQKRRTEPIELASLPNASHHKTLHLVNGVPHVTAFDGRSVPYTTAHKLALQRGMYSRKPDDPRFADVRLMPNLRSILDSKPPVVEATKENSLIGKNEYFKPIQQYATLPRHLSLSSDGVPVLQGDMGESMAHRPFTVVKSDSHAIIAGTELLSDLILAAGAGASGNDVVDMYINPRTFVGTKLYQESLTWLQFRFRKLIIEYIPFVGSGQAGGFIEFYTQDPNEVMLTGMAQRRNADEHDSNVDFQAFSYVACAMIPKPEDKTLYFMDATDANNDMRLVFQGRMIVTNNGVNADSSTVPMYGTFYAHYEVDFYFPTAYAGANQPFNGVINGIGDATPAVGNDVIVTNSLSSFGTVNNDDIFLAAVTPPTNGTNCQWVSPLGRVTNVVAGQQIVLGVVGKGSGSNWNLKMFQSIGDAAAGTNALQYAGTLPGASATWAFPNISKVSPNMLVLFKGTDDILLHEQFEQVPLGNPLVKTPPISTPEPLTASEISIIATRRHQNKERGMPSTSLPSFKTTSPNF